MTECLIRQYKAKIRLKRQDEIDLWEKMRAGDEDARQRLIESQLPWVIKLATDLARPQDDHDDLVQVGMAALVECVDRYDARKSRLSNWCCRPVRWAVMRHRQQTGTVVRRPQKRTEDSGSAWDAAGNRIDDYDLTILPGRPEPEYDEERQLMYEAINRLERPRDRYIVRQRLNGRTLRDIAAEVRVSKERVRQIYLRSTNDIRRLVTGSLV